MNFSNNFNNSLNCQMKPSLRKHGLSDTKFQLKYHTPHVKLVKSTAHQNSNIRKKEYSTVSRFETKQEGPLVLDMLIQLISRKQREACPLADHDQNPVRFVCLQENCHTRTGCSYCFLHGHKGHTKLESKLCLKDLEELKQKVQASRQQLKIDLQTKKTQFLGKIDKEIQSIRDDFCNNLDYLTKKIHEAVQATYQQKANAFSIYQSQRDKLQQSFQTKSQLPNYSSKFEPEIQDLIEKFKEKPKSDFNSTFSFSRTQQFKSITNSTTRTQDRYCLTREEQETMLVKLSKLNVTYVEQFLRQQALQATQFGECLKTYEQFYSELNSSLGEFFCAFKRAVPIPKPFHLALSHPEVLKIHCPS